MFVSRRDFLKYCGLSAAALGLSSTGLLRLEEALANPAAPSVIWIHGSSCTGCSVSFLDRIAATAPLTAADTLINSINLAFHHTLMGSAGESAVALAHQAYQAGNYSLVVEGGVPTNWGGAGCYIWSFSGQNVTFQQAVRDLSQRALKIICAGTCASFGGIPASGVTSVNPTGVQSVSVNTGKATINVAGCPLHPDWLCWVIVQLLTGGAIPLDSYSRPTQFYGQTVHSRCPRRSQDEANGLGQDNLCLEERGCKGPSTYANCPSQLWNNRQNWCCDANSPCVGCTNPTFPGTSQFMY
jgi:hydrogenase small subunit